MKASRLPQLDAIRGLAAMLVVVYHVQLVMGIDLVPGRIAAGGASGVGIFFVLSGFLMFRPFLDGPVDLRAYALRRILRVWPAYLLALVGCAVLLGVSAPAEHPLLFATLMQNYDPGHDFQVVGVSWTLTIEIAFYATVPLFAWIILRRPAHRQLPTLLWIGTASLLGHLAAVTVAVLVPDWPWRLVLVDAYPLMFWAFVPGMVLALLDARGVRLGHPIVLAAGIAMVAGGIWVHLQRLDVLTALGAMLLIGWSLTRSMPAMAARLAAVLGALSFGLYLWHYDVLQWVSRQHLEPTAAAVLGIAIVVAVASGSYVLVERPAMGLARTLATRLRGEPQAVAATPPDRAATAATPSS